MGCLFIQPFKNKFQIICVMRLLLMIFTRIWKVCERCLTLQTIIQQAKPLFSNKYKKIPGKFKDELSGIFKRNISFYISDNRVYLSNNRFVIVFSNIWRKKNKINNVEKKHDN